MSIKKTMLAAALAAFAFAALPALASAQPALEVKGSPHFTLAGAPEQLTLLTTAKSKVECTGVTGTGEFEDNPSTTGTIQFNFTGCKSSGTSCGTVTPASGEISTTDLTFHLVTATDVTGGEAVDGVLITPAESGHFATFKCAFGLVKVEVKGTGVIGEITDPDTGDPSSTFDVTFAEHNNEVIQTYDEADGDITGTFGLEAKVGSNPFEPAVQVGTGTGTFTSGENTLIEG